MNNIFKSVPAVLMMSAVCLAYDCPHGKKVVNLTEGYDKNVIQQPADGVTPQPLVVKFGFSVQQLMYVLRSAILCS